MNQHCSIISIEPGRNSIYFKLLYKSNICSYHIFMYHINYAIWKLPIWFLCYNHWTCDTANAVAGLWTLGGRFHRRSEVVPWGRKNPSSLRPCILFVDMYIQVQVIFSTPFQEYTQYVYTYIYVDIYAYKLSILNYLNATVCDPVSGTLFLLGYLRSPSWNHEMAHEMKTALLSFWDSGYPAIGDCRCRSSSISGPANQDLLLEVCARFILPSRRPT